MATLVCFHAHPDDEALSTGGLMAKAAAAGHRVVLVTATAGERGEPQPGVLRPDEELAARRVAELADAAALLGAEPPRLLGYVDSGMMGEPTNQDPSCFWQADVEAAAQQLAAILREVAADVLTVYDDHGLYGHPDHIQVHRVGHRAAELAGTPHVYESSVNRDEVRKLAERAGQAGQPAQSGQAGQAEPLVDPTAEGDVVVEDWESFGLATDDLAYAVDVSGQLDLKRAAMVAHRSQIGDDSFFLAMPEASFATMFGTEWYAVRGRTGTGGPELVPLLPGLT